MKAPSSGELAEALGVRRGDLVSLVGGGGKTTAMYRLATELHGRGLRVAGATTTKIEPPAAGDAARLLCAGDWDDLKESLAHCDREALPPVVGARLLPSGKVEGIPAAWCDRLLADGVLDALVVEADGSARRAVKAPEAWEPVVPTASTLFVAVLGLSCVGRPLVEEVAFRSEKVCQVTGAGRGTPLTPRVLAVLLTATEGLLKGRTAHMRAAVLLNQADLPGARGRGQELAREVFRRSASFERVVLASLRSSERSVEVLVP